MIMVNMYQKLSTECVGAIDISAILPIFRFFDFEKNGYWLGRYFNVPYRLTMYNVTKDGKTLYETADKLEAIIKFIEYINN